MLTKTKEDLFLGILCMPVKKFMRQQIINNRLTFEFFSKGIVSKYIETWFCMYFWSV